MIETIETLNAILALGGIGLLLGTAVLVFDLLTSRSLSEYVVRYGLLFAFLLTLCGTALTLVYSEYFGFVPCSLCWFQRIFLYPQLFISGAAAYLRDQRAAIYGILLSVPGLLFALYQHYIQMSGSDAIGCPTGGGDCAQRILFEYGFMTYPLLAACLFVFLIALYAYLLKARA